MNESILVIQMQDEDNSTSSIRIEGVMVILSAIHAECQSHLTLRGSDR